jgi:hypothetical protein
VPAVRVDAQSLQSAKSPDDLFRTISALDGALFDSYNRCDLEKFGTFFIDDVEFYHDQGGLSHPKAEESEPTGEAKFVHLWQNKDGAWKITRVISYDHHAPAK